MTSDPNTWRYQIYFRVGRGGIGIPYDLAKTEFYLVFEKYGIEVLNEWPARRRLWIGMSLPPDDIPALAADLGYTEAILGMRYEPYDGVEIVPIEKGRWYVGWVREQEWKVYQTEIYVQDAETLLEDAPNRRAFEIQYGGKTRISTGHQTQRGLSNLDARFMYNVAAPKPGDLILDPFAGSGGLVGEAKRRSLTIAASDIDPSLSPGLSAILPDRYGISDVRQLAFADHLFDAIITEPPFRTAYRQAVLDAFPELHRVLKPTGRLTILVAQDMREATASWFATRGYQVEHIATLPRGGGLKCPVLRIHQ